MDYDHFTCDICGNPMRLIKTTKNKRRTRVRRYVCTICGYSKTIFGNGYRDEIGDPEKAIEDVERMFKQEEENRR